MADSQGHGAFPARDFRLWLCYVGVAQRRWNNVGTLGPRPAHLQECSRFPLFHRSPSTLYATISYNVKEFAIYKVSPLSYLRHPNPHGPGKCPYGVLVASPTLPRRRLWRCGGSKNSRNKKSQSSYDRARATARGSSGATPSRASCACSCNSSGGASAGTRVAIPPAGHLTSTLVIKGEISGRDDLFIDGEVQGKIRLDEGKLTIGPNGRVTADVEAREIVIRGKVKGNLNGRERVQISQTGCATGDVVTQRILIEDGAEMHGRVEIKRVEVRQAQSEPAQEKKKPEPVAAVPPAAAPVVAKGASTTPSATPSTVTPSSVTPATETSATANKSAAEPVVATARQSAPVA